MCYKKKKKGKKKRMSAKWLETVHTSKVSIYFGLQAILILSERTQSVGKVFLRLNCKSINTVDMEIFNV